MGSDYTVQPLVTSPSAVSRRCLVNQKVMDKFAHMKTMLLLFCGPRWETKIIDSATTWHLRIETFKHSETKL